MYQLRVVSDPDECRLIWEAVMPTDNLVDLWEVRSCFQNHYRRQYHFIVVEKTGKVHGFLPFSRIDENGSYGYFPGEIWHGKTWLEQNRLIASNRYVQDIILDHLRATKLDYHLRYMLMPERLAGDYPVDETGYLFNPVEYAYDMQNYFARFSHKSAKRILRSVEEMKARGVEYRYDNREDFELLAAMNNDRYQDESYFSDPRFTASFRDLMNLLADRGWMRMTTVLIEGKPAAVDLGSVYNGVYTLLAGGTAAEFPGVAKLINLHHMQWACDTRQNQVDFLCGEFSWKPMFHLSPRPLHLISSTVTMPVPIMDQAMPHPHPSAGVALASGSSVHG